MDVVKALKAVFSGEKRVSFSRLSDKDVDFFCSSVKHETQLDLTFRDLSSESVRAVSGLCASGKVEHISFISCNVGSESLKDVLMSSSVKSLYLSLGDKDDWVAVDAFLEHLRKSNLEELRLFHTKTSGRLGNLFNAISGSKLQRLSFGEGSVTGSDFAGLAHVDVPSLKALHVNCSIGKQGVIYLADAISCNRVPWLEELELRAVGMESYVKGANHVLALANSLQLQLPKLKKIDVSFNSMSKEEANAFAQLCSKDLESFKMLGVELSINVELFTVEQAQILGKSIRKSSTLKELKINLEYGKQFQTDLIYAVLVDAVKENKSGLRACDIEIENWSAVHELKDKNALMIKQICSERTQEYLAQRRKQAAKKVVVPKNSVSSAVPIAIVLGLALVGAIWFFHVKRNE